MKRVIGALFLGMFLLAVTVPLGVPGAPPPVGPMAAPPRLEPKIALTITATGEKRTMLMEEYIAGVVAAEMGDSFPEEALAAQAILARTYSLRRMQVGAPLTDDPGRVQAYKPERITEKVRTAVDRTRGSVITYQRELVDAVYHACAGGRTATAAEGMAAPDKLYLRPVADPPCPENETWTTVVPAATVAAAAGVQLPLQSVGIGERGPSGRALSLVVNGKAVNIFRMAGALELKSNYLTGLAIEGKQVRISGRGFGHGVGLSQWGAAALAKKGFTAEEIIQHYFSDVEIAIYW